MDVIEVLISVALGGGSYLAVNFWMDPLLRYTRIKHAVRSDAVFYANAFRHEESVEASVAERNRERKDRARQHAAEIRASYYELPGWYRCMLKNRNEDPVAASRALIQLSNTSDPNGAVPFEKALARALNMPEDFST